MRKKEDKIEHLEDYVRKKEAEEAAWQKIIKPMKWICRTSVIGAAIVIREIALFCYHHSVSIKAAIDAYIKSENGQ